MQSVVPEIDRWISAFVYFPHVDTAYIALTETENGRPWTSVLPKNGSRANRTFEMHNGKITAVEVSQASKTLSAEALESARWTF